jgi:hypothetical protein
MVLLVKFMLLLELENYHFGSKDSWYSKLVENRTGKILSKDKSSINVQSGIRAFGLKRYI